MARLFQNQVFYLKQSKILKRIYTYCLLKEVQKLEKEYNTLIYLISIFIISELYTISLCESVI